MKNKSDSLEQLSLYDLNQHVRRVLALNFSEALWISCEIAQAGQSRGHWYIDLVQKSTENDEIIAKCQAILWAKQFYVLKRKLGRQLDKLLQEGTEVKILAKVDFHERYGLKLTIEDIDPSYTIGQLEVKRQATIAVLQAQKLIGKNSQIPFAPVLQRIAVISSETAAGYQDFIAQIANNPYGYAYKIQLHKAAVQGIYAEQEIIKQLNRIESYPKAFDAVVIIRGGGAKLDLAAFDGLELCQRIANCPLPVITGIGHETDESVADLVAHSPLKTPTAVAEYLINHNMQFESTLLHLGLMIKDESTTFIKEQALLLQDLEHQVKSLPKYKLDQQKQILSYIEQELPRLVQNKVNQSKTQLNNLAQVVQILSPETALKRGFTMTMKNGVAIKSSKGLDKGDKLTTVFKDGKVDSTVN